MAKENRAESTLGPKEKKGLYGKKKFRGRKKNAGVKTFLLRGKILAQ